MSKGTHTNELEQKFCSVLLNFSPGQNASIASGTWRDATATDIRRYSNKKHF